MKKDDSIYCVWVSMLTVKPLEGNNDLGEAKNAVVNVLYFTDTKENYIKDVTLKMNEFGYSIIEMEDIDLFDFGAKSKDLVSKAQALNINDRFNWGNFYISDEIQ